MKPYLIIHEKDNCAIALNALSKGSVIEENLTLQDDIPTRHKFALTKINTGDLVFKYGFSIGQAQQTIEKGQWIHEHNLRSCLKDLAHFSYKPEAIEFTNEPPDTFDGFIREDGNVGTRNEIWIITTVGCVNTVANKIVSHWENKLPENIDGIFHFPHPFGCSQLGDDLINTQKILAGLINHPNAGGVLILGLGCENNQINQLLNLIPKSKREAILYFNCQQVVDEFAHANTLVTKLIQQATHCHRKKVKTSELVIGLKCGGSDAYSGLTANPLLGKISEKLCRQQAKVMLTEIPEMFGAEESLLSRCSSPDIFDQTLNLLNDFRQYYISHQQPIHKNPSPGNLDGGITTLEEKSIGAIQKAGNTPIAATLLYGMPCNVTGLNILQAPGNDAISGTALVASGATILLFTTGRGTPLGFPIPTLKISSHHALYQHKPHWIDFDASTMLSSPTTTVENCYKLLLDIASGKSRTCNEKTNSREISIWKTGVVL